MRVWNTIFTYAHKVVENVFQAIVKIYNALCELSNKAVYPVVHGFFLKYIGKHAALKKFQSVLISHQLIVVCGGRHFKGATSRFVHLETFSLKFLSSSFAIRFNLLHPRPSMFRFYLFPPVWCLYILANYYFKVSLHLKENFYVVAPLRTIPIVTDHLDMSGFEIPSIVHEKNEIKNSLFIASTGTSFVME